MKDLQWFPPIPEPRTTLVPKVMGSLIAAASLGGLLFARGHHLPAIVVWAMALLLALSLNFPTLRKHIMRAANWLSAAAGYVTTFLVLWPFYVVVFGGVRLVLSVTRVDPLSLRLQSDQPSYWQAAVAERKRAKYYERLFTVESTRRESNFLVWLVSILAFVLILAGSSELILRSMGFGHPIVYRVDPRVGYYPAPNQDVHRYGGEIHINAFGMRSRNVVAGKPAAVFRILMLGDSTLYGGSYIDQREIYASRLEDLLNQNPGLLPGSPQKVEVLCMGVNGWGPQHEFAFVKEFGVFNADFVMVMGPPNDAYRPRYGISHMPFFAEGHQPRFAWQEFTQHVLWEYNQRLTGTGENFESGPQAGRVVADGVAAWLEIATLAQQRGAGVDFELLPNEDEAREGKASDSTQRVLDGLLPELAKRRIPEAYPLILIRDNLASGKLYHDGAHLDVAGHRVYASYLRDRVVQLVRAQ
jgi:hypothetical protein